ncbi:MAG: DUF1501 domain-containing protein [Pseudomarimonas sp.]
MSLNRREFLRNSLLTAGALAIPGVSLGFAGKATGGGTVIAVYLRGGADGLNMVAPWADANYYRLRPRLAVPRPDAASGGLLNLDGFFGLHPSMLPIQSLYSEGKLAIVHACGATHGSRSHFDAQELMERGVNNKSGATSGWLGRAVETLPRAGIDPFISTAVGNAVPRAFAGAVPAIGITSVDGFDIDLNGNAEIAARYAIAHGYSRSSNIGVAAMQTVEAIDLLKTAQPSQFISDPAALYPATTFGNNLKQLVQLLKADIGIRTAGLDLGGWDHHDSEAGYLAPLLDQLSKGLAAMHRDLGALANTTSIVVMSEFGRRAFENGSLGTDHGTGNLMLILGGGVRGGRVYANWPGLNDTDLDRGDLKITTDYRQVAREVLAAQLPEVDLDYVTQDYAGGASIGLFG